MWSFVVFGDGGIVVQFFFPFFYSCLTINGEEKIIYRWKGLQRGRQWSSVTANVWSHYSRCIWLPHITVSVSVCVCSSLFRPTKRRKPTMQCVSVTVWKIEQYSRCVEMKNAHRWYGLVGAAEVAMHCYLFSMYNRYCITDRRTDRQRYRKTHEWYEFKHQSVYSHTNNKRACRLTLDERKCKPSKANQFVSNLFHHLRVEEKSAYTYTHTSFTEATWGRAREERSACILRWTKRISFICELWALKRRPVLMPIAYTHRNRNV